MERNRNCTLCPLHQNVKNVCIPGYGNPNPRFLFVGEAPGEAEDEQDQPFVGRSGQLLREHIKKFDLRTARLSNVVRCRPPENREPSYEEIKACRGYLADEIKETRPKFIVAVGGTALLLLTKKTGITFWSGRMAGMIQGIPIIGLMHPSYVLRSGNYDDFRKDCVSVKEVADTIDLFRRNFPDIEIMDAVGFTGGFTHENQDAEESSLIRFKARLRADLMADLPKVLERTRKEKRKAGA